MKKNIVIVDNDKDCLEIFGEFFEQQGFNAIKISNASQLVQFIEGNQTDIIISDAEFLFGENENTVALIKEKIEKIPILYLTEKNKLKILENKMKIRHEKMIEKPVLFLNLLESVNRELTA